ncbi:MAG: helix-turn-helix transcriptional regulator [Neptuniibacter sp.]
MSEACLANPTFDSGQPWFALNSAGGYQIVLSSHPSISHFYRFKADQNNELTFAIPDGCVDIIIDCDSVSKNARVCGSTLEARCAGFKQGHFYFGVRFKFGVFPDLLDISANELVNHEHSLLELVPDFDCVIEDLVTEPEFVYQAEIFQRFYSNKQARIQSSLTQNVVSLIREKRGDVSVKHLENETGYSSRTIRRQLQSDLGMSPKVLSRIIRCQFAVTALQKSEVVNFSELAYELGFSDQPHFLREFKKLVSATPLEFQRCLKAMQHL